ncbi:MAG: hypothetical protein HY296_00985 [Thaumarchaeota archaeon]|nr:hypothetical protein [Nitrososphaerota archaeon]
MSRTVFQGPAQKASSVCGYCGRTLGSGFFYKCHVCGATYCYAHSPQKCDHKQAKLPIVNLFSGKA